MWSSPLRRGAALIATPALLAQGAVPRRGFSRAAGLLTQHAVRDQLPGTAALCGCYRQPQRGFHATLRPLNEDLYELLGVPRDASASDIKKAYYKQAKKYHPDTNKGDPAAAKKFAAVTEAYEVLTDEPKRQAYDTYGHAGLDGQGGGGGGPGGFGGFGGQGFGFQQGFSAGSSPEDIFRAFEQAFNVGGRVRRGPPRGRDVQVSMTLSLLEAAKGCKKTVSWRSPSAGSRQLEVEIPAGVDSGMNMRILGEGEPGEGGPGNLYLVLSVAEHEVFERDGNDVHIKVRLTLAEAILGAKVVIPTMDGAVTLKVPPGTRTGDRRVMQGRGVQTSGGRSGGGAGHQFVHFEVQIPTSLSARGRELVEQLAKEEPPIGDEDRSRRGTR